MKRLSYTIPAIALAFTLALAPSVTAFAHGHHGGHHSESNTNYYYCNGHEAHLHDGNGCPYANSDSAQDDTTTYYYCDGHEAHLHDNNICPYANSVPVPDAGNSDSAANYDSSNSANNNSNGNSNTANPVPGRTYGRRTLRHSCHIVYTP